MALLIPLLGLLIVQLGLTESLLYLGAIPIILTALYQERRIAYLGSGAIVILTALWTAQQVSADFGESIKTITLSGLTLLVLSEILYTLSVARRQAETAQRESEARYRAIFDASPNAMSINEPDSLGERYIEVNETYIQVTGYRRDQLIGKSPLEVGFWHNRPQHDEFVTTLERDGVVNNFEAEFRLGDDRMITAVISARMISLGGRPYVLSIVRDITAQKKAEQALQANQQFLQDVFDAIRDGISVLDADLNILQVNHWMETLYQEQMPLIGKKCYVAYQRRNARCPWCPSVKTLKTGDAHTEIVPYPSADAPAGWLELSAFPIKDANGRVVKIIEYVKDITARVRAEQEKEHLQERLMQAQKMEAIGRLAGGIAHDFNNILTAIQGYTEFLLQAFADDSPQKDLSAAQVRADLREVMAAANRAQGLTQQLLAFSRKQILQPRVISLSETITDLERMLRPLLGEDIQIFEHLAYDRDHVHADPTQIEQIVLNLAVNARDAMPNGGRLTFEVTHLTVDQEFAYAHPGLHSGEYVQLSISDTGIGMSDEVKAHLFEPFFTTKEQGKGTGLGLATVYAIVEQLNGYISVYSEEGIGSTFKIYLPHAAGPSKPAAPTMSNASMPAGNETILVAEDEEMVRLLINRVLSRCGYTVLVAEQPADALALARAHQTPIDLLITDVIMPEMGGKELATQLATIHPETCVLFISGYTDNAIVHQGVLKPGIHFVQKPFTPTDLAAKVRKILDDKNR